MRNMLQSMGMPMPMPMGLFDGFGGQPSHSSLHHDPLTSMMPHGFMNPMSMMMMDPFQSMQQAMSMANNGTGGFSYCSSSVTSYTTDEHGRPQVYQQSNEVRQGPDGLKETKSAVRDSRTGHQELAIGHHIRDKSHMKKKSKNVYTGEEEQVEDFVNLDEAEAASFEQDWSRRAREISSYNNQIQSSSRSSGNNRLALTYSPTHRQSPYSSSHAKDKAALKSKKKKSQPKESK